MWRFIEQVINRMTWSVLSGWVYLWLWEGWFCWHCSAGCWSALGAGRCRRLDGSSSQQGCEACHCPPWGSSCGLAEGQWAQSSVIEVTSRNIKQQLLLATLWTLSFRWVYTALFLNCCFRLIIWEFHSFHFHSFIFSVLNGRTSQPACHQTSLFSHLVPADQTLRLVEVIQRRTHNVFAVSQEGREVIGQLVNVHRVGLVHLQPDTPSDAVRLVPGGKRWLVHTTHTLWVNHLHTYMQVFDCN